MSAMRRNISMTRGAVLAFALIVGWAVVGEAAYVITTSGKRVDGTDIRAKSNGDIILQTKVGAQTFSRAQVAQAVADKPETWDQARQLIASGKYDQAVPLLEDIIRKYRFLGWDEQARALIPQAYAGKNDFPSAVKAYEELFKLNPKSEENEEIKWSYREMLLKAGGYTKLEPMLTEDIKNGSRSDAARAQILRGDIRRAQGQLEPAALDYLRTAILFEKEEAQQPEALFKAASALEELRDRRYKELYQKVASDYPNSPYAAEARKKL